MKKIDFLYRNFDVEFFLKYLEIKLDEETPIQFALLNSIKDIQSIKSRLSYYKYYKGKSNKNIFSDFIKKYKDNYKDENVEKFFRKRGLINDSVKHFIDESESFQFYELKKNLITTGEFFRKLNKFFNISFYASLTRKDFPEASSEDAYLLYCSVDKIYRLCVFFFEEDGNDHEYVYKKFKKRPSDEELLEILRKKGMQFVTDKNLVVSIVKPFVFTKFWKEQGKKAFLEKHQEEKIFKDEKDFLKHCDDNGSIFYYLNLDPEKYYKIIKPKTQKSNYKKSSTVFLDKKIKSLSQEARFIIRLLTEYWENNPKEKIINNNFFKYLMNTKFNWYQDRLFIMDLIYKCNDLDTLMSLIHPKFLNDKEMMEEVRILKLFRNKSKDFLVKVFKKNQKMIGDLFANYVPEYIKNDPLLMMEALKIDINLMPYIGKELKKKNVFMSKVNNLVKSK
jgi:hypothetical protein